MITQEEDAPETTPEEAPGPPPSPPKAVPSTGGMFSRVISGLIWGNDPPVTEAPEKPKNGHRPTYAQIDAVIDLFLHNKYGNAKDRMAFFTVYDVGRMLQDTGIQRTIPSADKIRTSLDKNPKIGHIVESDLYYVKLNSAEINAGFKTRAMDYMLKKRARDLIETLSTRVGKALDEGLPSLAVMTLLPSEHEYTGDDAFAPKGAAASVLDFCKSMEWSTFWSPSGTPPTQSLVIDLSDFYEPKAPPPPVVRDPLDD